jgi:phosphatidate cytidylyltransferase
MLAQRLASAAVGIPLIALAIWAGGSWLTGVVSGAVLVAVLEIEAARGSVVRPGALLAGALAASLPPAAQLGLDWMTWFVTGVALLPVAGLALAKEPRAAVEEWLWIVGPVIYIGWLASHFVLLRAVDDGRSWLFLGIFTVWITDTGAYFVGRLIGRHKLAPAVSPGKTWEGAIGGQLAGFAAVAGLEKAFGLDLALGHIVALGLLVPFVAQVGDLAESALKRGLGVKDSSHLVPGHGGIADRLDSLLFAAPVIYYYLQWLIL